METLRELFLIIGLDADESKFASAQAAVDGLEAVLGLAKDAAVALEEALVETVFGTAEFAGALGDAATATGVGVEHLQELGYAAVQSGTSLDELQVSLNFLNRNLYEAAHGSTTAAAAFAQMGVRTRDANGQVRGTYDVLLDLARSFARMPPGAERSARAMELFGRSGAKLLPLLTEGEAGLKRFADEAREMGVVMSEEQVAAAKAFDDAWAGLGEVVSGVKHELGGLLIDALAPFLDDVKEWIRLNRQLISQRVKQFVDGLRAALNIAGKAFNWVRRNIDTLVLSLKLLGLVIGSYALASLTLLIGSLIATAGGFGAAAAAAGTAAVAFITSAASAAAAWLAAAAPVVALTAAFALLGLAVNDVWTFMHGGRSVIGTFGVQWTKFIDTLLKPNASDSWIRNLLKDISRDLFDIDHALEKLDKGEGWFQFTTLGQLIKGVRWLMSNADIIKATLQDAATALTTGKWGGAADALRASQSTQAWVEGLGGRELRAARQSVGVFNPQTNITLQALPGESAEETAERIAQKVDERFRLHLDEAFNAVTGKYEPQ